MRVPDVLIPYMGGITFMPFVRESRPEKEVKDKAEAGGKKDGAGKEGGKEGKDDKKDQDKEKKEEKKEEKGGKDGGPSSSASASPAPTDTTGKGCPHSA